VNVLRSPQEATAAERAVAIGTFDGVHLGHRAVIERAKATGMRSGVVTFDPHPRSVLGYEVQLLATFGRRVELISELQPDDLLVVEFTPELSRLAPEEFIEAVLRPFGGRVVVAGEGFRFGAQRRGDLELLRRLGFGVEPVPLVAEEAPGGHGTDGGRAISSSRIRELLRAGQVRAAAGLLGRPHELEGTVVSGDQRGGTLGFPTANLSVSPELLVPAYGIYAGAARRPLGTGTRAEADSFRTAVSIGVNPHYGGVERRIEAFLLDFEGDLYGERLRLELWDRLREERAFESETELVDQIALDVEAARAATRPDSPR
jgi:riboflavin kinase/FMN adenylyltransferase